MESNLTFVSSACSSLVKQKVLLHGFTDIPGTAHTRREGDKVSFAKGGRLASIGRSHGDLASQQVARFRLIVGPGKLRDTAAPGTPTEDSLLFQKGLVGLRNDFNFDVGG